MLTLSCLAGAGRKGAHPHHAGEALTLMFLGWLAGRHMCNISMCLRTCRQLLLALICAGLEEATATWCV